MDIVTTEIESLWSITSLLGKPWLIQCLTSCGSTNVYFRSPGTICIRFQSWYGFFGSSTTINSVLWYSLIDYQTSISTLSEKRIDAYLSYSPDPNQSGTTFEADISIENWNTILVFDGSWFLVPYKIDLYYKIEEDCELGIRSIR